MGGLLAKEERWLGRALQSIGFAATIAAIDPLFGPEMKPALASFTTTKFIFHRFGCCGPVSFCCGGPRFSGRREQKRLASAKALEEISQEPN